MFRTLITVFPLLLPIVGAGWRAEGQIYEEYAILSKRQGTKRSTARLAKRSPVPPGVSFF